MMCCRYVLVVSVTVIGCTGTPDVSTPATGLAESNTPLEPIRLMLASPSGSFVPYGEPWPGPGTNVTLLADSGFLDTATVTSAEQPDGCNPWTQTGRMQTATAPVVATELPAMPPCYYTGSGCYALPHDMATLQQIERSMAELPGGNPGPAHVVALQGLTVPATARSLDPDSFGWPRNVYMAVDLDGDGAPDLITESELCEEQDPSRPVQRCYDTWQRTDHCSGIRDDAFCRIRRDRVVICDDPER